MQADCICLHKTFTVLTIFILTLQTPRSLYCWWFMDNLASMLRRLVNCSWTNFYGPVFLLVVLFCISLLLVCCFYFLSAKLSFGSDHFENLLLQLKRYTLELNMHCPAK